VSSLAVGRIGDIIGRRRTIWYGALIFVVGGIFQTCAWSMAIMIIGRVISGIGVGLLSYVPELIVCPDGENDCPRLPVGDFAAA
jgi:MFS family permease